MSDSLPPTLTPDMGRRKLVAIGVAALCVLVMAFAFLSGGKKTTATKDKETDTPVGTLQDGPDLLAGGTTTPDDWFLNAPDGGVVAQTGTEQPTTSTDSKKTSSVVTGDDPAANPPAGGTATSTGTVATTTKSGQNANSGSATTKSTTGVVVAADLASKSSDTSKSSQASTSVVADHSSTSSQKAESSGTVASQPNPASNGLPEAITTGNADRVASSKKADASTPPSTAGSSAAPRDDLLEFVRPVAKRPGLIAQSRALVTERQFKRARASEPATKEDNSTQKSSSPAPAPVVVPKEEAEDYARRTTETLRQQGTLKPTQTVRLPRQQETINARVWREEDTPATAQERRPFGLVVEDTNPASTPEGIPLRTDIPAGTSPLEKTGADKPLWKRPE